MGFISQLRPGIAVNVNQRIDSAILQFSPYGLVTFQKDLLYKLRRRSRSVQKINEHSINTECKVLQQSCMTLKYFREILSFSSSSSHSINQECLPRIRINIQMAQPEYYYYVSLYRQPRGKRDKDSTTTCPEGDVTWTINTERGLK